MTPPKVVKKKNEDKISREATPPKVAKKKNAEDKPSREATPPKITKKATKEKPISVMLQGDASSENYKSISKLH